MPHSPEVETAPDCEDTHHGQSDPKDLRSQPVAATALLGLSAAILSACGGGGGASGGGASGGGTPPPVFIPPTRSEASRFLHQATFGASMSSLDDVVAVGFSAWLTRQFNTAPMDSHFAYVTRGGSIGCTTCESKDMDGLNESFWQQAIVGPDALRQRIVFALTELFVISGVNSSIEYEPLAFASYMDMLAAKCFGNFRDLIEGVALHPAMGHYLSHFQNLKEDPATGRIPDENFAREVMQLFTIGLWELNEDGSRRKDMSGKDIPTYSQDDISGMAKVFTGYSWGGADTSEDRWYGWEIGGISTVRWDLPMQPYAQYASASEKRIIKNVVIPANTGPAASIKTALDTLFNHSNVGPFIGKQLIKRLVTSNPSPAYVARVTQAFNNNGSGVRGDMKAVIAAILLDDEARNSGGLSSSSFGKLREPIVRVANWARAFDVKSNKDHFEIWSLEDVIWAIGQNVFRAPSVFNWFRPEYAPPGAVAAAGLTAPEFQITYETTITSYCNFITGTVIYGLNSWKDGTVKSDYSREKTLVLTPDSLLDHLNLLLCAGQLSATTRKLISDTIASTSTDPDELNRRIYMAITMVMLSSEYLIQK